MMGISRDLYVLVEGRTHHVYIKGRLTLHSFPMREKEMQT